ncbi:bifunctional tRNA (5-methylaminomethyl-2-thiouridine)(34)-methyltransferase MnmD/FAD-dependent 5-carboxymethylaminomethyl-2-thiouridine(34) oxidoreductase MnmC [Stutzerimonas urumqiensis]|uniref:bifunctional tRNA (5-methylaminomethyl-2-thiouridine)(34)-methyltransferase MnmD/FAD-dependent 5-carboxymethylaminomethyl-2-thiouridine(34) oxidoreductase MnmC n=1 Tax=Stutzerimonas urumqiensis TaxID=638269 RepID=UPI000EAD9430|nr:bifunctional tRNA (5-methylaminomethyl-2-thiouridine)(34)-methyltransferase MnmD/FAD-dependent 5-carboxymethylaminomethyl-2-thiouridine(34) oxidoreductase MnmC [Stutzerimonas urumqiensis]
MSDRPAPSEFQPAALDWDAHGQPQSRRYGDVYFSRASGLEETRHVFLAQNDLERRFAALGEQERLVIGETGFGTGLNFLCAWSLFASTAPSGARLHFVSVEKHPLTRDDLARALRLWPSLAEQAAALLGQYRAIHPGFQRLVFDGGRVTLTLLIGDVLDTLPTLDASVDAWFLDGFAPAKNPDMWQPALFAELARLSAPGATLGTFTSAGFVRRGLIEAGFDMARVPGFGHKREILRGRYIGSAQTPVDPWYARPPKPAADRRALVIGAGLAGCATAASLAARGWQVSLIERHAEVAQEGSGNPQGVLYLKLSAHGTALSQLVVAGFGHTRRLLERLQRGADWDACGVLQLAFDEREQARQAQLAAAYPADLLRAVDRAEAQALAGVGLDSGGLFFPDAGWLHPPALCRWLASQPGITQVTHREAIRLRRIDDEWEAQGDGQVLGRAPVVVLAGAADITHFEQTAGLPLKRIRGQITQVPATAASQSLCTVLCAEGYVAPVRGTEHTLGASFDFAATDLSLRAEEHRSNLDLLAAISPDLHARLEVANLNADSLEGRAAYRCTTPDYLPLVGPLADASAFADRYAALGKDARLRPDTPCPWRPGLYVNAAHGSRGLITAPLAAELVAAWIEDEPLPLPRAVAQACHPNRFLLRQVVRGTPAPQAGPA